ncbi:MAG: putative membrane protein [Bacteroidia bacterium]|jgi:putative membrane protein
MAMGAADVVPGVSGGTIAFITGIYQELLDTIKGFNLSVFKTLKEEGIKATWQKTNATFLVVLFAGIFTSVISLAKGITFLLATYPILLWAFFFGLIVASSLIIGKYIKEWNAKTIGMMILGAAIAFYITIAAPSQIPDGLIYIFLSGCIAICAMILPGISGSFILLLLGAYATVLGSISGLVDGIKEFDIQLITKYGLNISIFMLGCIVGIVSFSNFLSWMFKKAYSLTMALLTGFMIGSLNKVWPWKETLETRINSHGAEVPFLQSNVSPFKFEEITGELSQLWFALGLCIVGFLVVFVMEKMAASK